MVEESKFHFEILKEVTMVYSVAQIHSQISCVLVELQLHFNSREVKVFPEAAAVMRKMIVSGR